MQRREIYRNVLPTAQPKMVKLVSGKQTNLGTWPIHDLSVGGLGAIVIGESNLQLGQKIPNLQIILSNNVIIESRENIVRHITVDPSGKRTKQYRLGLIFGKLPRAMGVAIQRYLINLERERRKLQTK